MRLEEMDKSVDSMNLAKSYLNNLKNDAGWLLVCQVAQQNMDILKEQILKGRDGNVKLTPEEVDRKRDKLQAYEDVLGTPDMLLGNLEPSKPVIDKTDPYSDVEDLLEYRKKQDN